MEADSNIGFGEFLKMPPMPEPTRPGFIAVNQSNSPRLFFKRRGFWAMLLFILSDPRI